MKKTLIIPMAFIALSSTSIGTGLIANEAINPNDSHIEKMMPSNFKTMPTEITTTITATTDIAILITNTWTEGITTTSALTYSLALKTDPNTSLGTVNSNITSPPTVGEKVTDIIIINKTTTTPIYELTTNTEYIVSAVWKSGTTQTAKTTTNVTTASVSTPIIFGTTSETFADRRISVRPPWLAGSDTIKEVSYRATANQTNSKEVSALINNTSGIDSARTVFTGMEPNTEYTITGTLTLTTLPEEVIIEPIKVTTNKEAPTISISEPTNHSEGKVQFTIDHDDKNSKIIADQSKVIIKETAIPTNNRTLELNEDSFHIYTIDDLKPGVEHTIEASIQTEWTTPEAGTVVRADSKTITTIDAAVDSTITTDLAVTTTANNFGQEDGTLDLTVGITPRKSFDNITEVKAILNDGTDIETVAILPLPTMVVGTEFVLEHSFVARAGEHNVKVIVTATNSPTTTQPIVEEVIVEIETVPLFEMAIVNKALANDNGDLVYKVGDLTATITNHINAKPIETTNIDATEANFRLSEYILPPTPTSTSTNVEVTTEAPVAGLHNGIITMSLTSELIIPNETALAGYTLELTGLLLLTTYFDLPLDEYLQLEVVSFEAGLGAGPIIGIVVGSWVGIMIIGSGGYWIYNKKSKN